MARLPTGTVTFLFTDIAGSTALLQRLGDRRYADVLAEHRSLLREAFAEGNGQEIDTLRSSAKSTKRFAACRPASSVSCRPRQPERKRRGPEFSTIVYAIPPHMLMPASSAARWRASGALQLAGAGADRENRPRRAPYSAVTEPGRYFHTPLFVSLRADFAHRFAFEVEFVGVMNQAIENRVGDRNQTVMVY